ncbi:MAG: hypothetical protein ACR2PM_13020, partial [Hyphomicrobiales bacterium]
MTPEVRKVIRDAKRSMKRCQRMNAELDGRIARLEHLDLIASATENADELKSVLKTMQASVPLGAGGRAAAASS